MQDWFERLTGFVERDYIATQAALRAEGQILTSLVNGASYGIGTLSTPCLAELRERSAAACTLLAGELRVSNVVGDVGVLHQDAANAGSLFQVASQFNLLEMVGPSVVPEDGVTGYAHDSTQGPVCAIACGAATLFRNYLVMVEGKPGQTRDRQIDCLSDLGDALGNQGRLMWGMRNGYALPTADGLTRVNQALNLIDDAEMDRLRGQLRIGLHSDVEVTTAGRDGRSGHHVTQALCSALPVAYSGFRSQDWAALALLVLEATYEATLCAGALNARNTGNPVVWLTQVGGGAFGNRRSWIRMAMDRAFAGFENVGLDVRIVHYGAIDAGLEALARDYSG
jgi:hypothetical protein